MAGRAVKGQKGLEWLDMDGNNWLEWLDMPGHVWNGQNGWKDWKGLEMAGNGGNGQKLPKWLEMTVNV